MTDHAALIAEGKRTVEADLVNTLGRQVSLVDLVRRLTKELAAQPPSIDSDDIADAMIPWVNARLDELERDEWDSRDVEAREEMAGELRAFAYEKFGEPGVAAPVPPPDSLLDDFESLLVTYTGEYPERTIRAIPIRAIRSLIKRHGVAHPPDTRDRLVAILKQLDIQDWPTDETEWYWQREAEFLMERGVTVAAPVPPPDEDKNELERLRRYRDQREAQVRGEVPEAKTLSADDADYLRTLASYGGRMVNGAWLCSYADRIDATIVAAPVPPLPDPASFPTCPQHGDAYLCGCRVCDSIVSAYREKKRTVMTPQPEPPTVTKAEMRAALTDEVCDNAIIVSSNRFYKDRFRDALITAVFPPTSGEG